MPPTISASSETIQPVEMISRLEVSTFTAWPGSVTAVTPPKRRSIAAATSCGRQPSFTVTPIVVTSRGRRASAWTVGSGQDDAVVDEAVAGVEDADDRKPPRCPPRPGCRALCPEPSPTTASSGVRGLRPATITKRCIANSSGSKPKTRPCGET